MQKINQLEFTNKLKTCLERTAAMLEQEIRPIKMDEESHQYDDKFALANFTTDLALDTVTTLLHTAFAGLGDRLEKKESNIKYELKFEALELCEYLEERVRTTSGPEVTTSETKNVSGTLFGNQSKTKEVTTQVTTRVPEYVWTHTLTYSAKLVDRKNRSIVETLLSRTRSREISTTVKDHQPKPFARKESAPLYLDLEMIKTLPRSIDRSRDSCKTPRRNQEIDDVFSAFQSLATFTRAVRGTMPDDHHIADAAHQEKVVKNFFSPAACSFLCKKNDHDEAKSFIVPDKATLLNEMQRTLSEQQASVRRTADEAAKATKGGELVGPDEASLLYVLKLLAQTVTDYIGSVTYLENMLRSQLEAAVGRELTADAFEEYVLYHDRLLFSPDFKPRPFSYAVRRSASAFPDGSIQIRTIASKQPIRTLTRDVTLNTPGPVRVALGGADSIAFDGPRYAHAYRAQTFSGATPKPLELVANARHFSGFVLLVGKVVAADEFQPDHAIIIQNKDELIIPLILNPLPTPKEFADAIESLSPEQRAFCEAFRAMQLSSSLCGLVVIQLKPAIEKVLNLPDGALTKEIALTDQLLNFFIEYQISTDMLAYDGPQDVDKATKLTAVKGHVASITNVIQAARDEDLKRTAEEAVHRKMLEGELSLSMASSAYSEDEEADDLDVDNCFEEEEAKPRRAMMKMKKKGGISLGGLRREKAGPPIPSKMMERMVKPPPAPPAPKPSAPAAPGAGSAAAPTPTPPQESLEEKEQGTEGKDKLTETPQIDDFEDVEFLDITQLPKRLDASFKVLDTDSQLRPTTIKISEPWRKTFKKSILAEPQTQNISDEGLAKERSKAFDLLDALTRSGAIPLGAELHVIICATHAFDKSIVDTIIVDNVNPILKTERASLIIATTLHDRPVADIVESKMLSSVAISSPLLLPAANAEEIPEAKAVTSDDI
uniref:Uncharacterized protein n=1 Tax=Aureoumbra lagunensis TaxID=44058 RepID=A0A7S3K0K0_9STRA